MVSMNDTRLVEALSNASSLELFDLSRIIDRLLADPYIGCVRSFQRYAPASAAASSYFGSFFLNS